MARQFSAAVQNKLDQDDIEFFFLIKLEFSANYLLTSFNSDVTFDSQTYTADSGLFEYDPPKQTSVVDRESYRVVISDVSNALYAEFNNGVIGKDITVYCGLLDDNGEPMTGTDDVIIVYKGYVDTPTIENNFGEKYAVIEGTSPMSDLDAANTFVCSRDGMDQKSTADTSFDSIYEDNEIVYKWGKV